MVYPNPANDILYVKEITSDEIIRIYYNLLGQKMLNVNYSGGIDISGLNPGVYFLGIKINEGIKYRLQIGTSAYHRLALNLPKEADEQRFSCVGFVRCGIHSFIHSFIFYQYFYR